MHTAEIWEHVWRRVCKNQSEQCSLQDLLQGLHKEAPHAQDWRVVGLVVALWKMFQDEVTVARGAAVWTLWASWAAQLQWKALRQWVLVGRDLMGRGVELCCPPHPQIPHLCLPPHQQAPLCWPQHCLGQSWAPQRSSLSGRRGTPPQSAHLKHNERYSNVTGFTYLIKDKSMCFFKNCKEEHIFTSQLKSYLHLFITCIFSGSLEVGVKLLPQDTQTELVRSFPE